MPVTEGEPGAILEIFDALGESLTVVVVSFSAIAPYEMEKTMLKEQITLALVNFAQALVANQTDANSRERIQQATERFLAAYRGQSEVVYLFIILSTRLKMLYAMLLLQLCTKQKRRLAKSIFYT